MSSKLIYSEDVLSGNEHWSRLDDQWGTPVDLETDEDYFTPPTNMQSFYSTMDLRKPTFDSAVILKRMQSKTSNSLSKKTQDNLGYDEFIQPLDRHAKDSPKQFYFVGGHISSALSVDEICENIDNIFKSIEKLCASTSTVRVKKKEPVPKIQTVIECSFPASDLSFDDTELDLSEKEKSDGDDLDRYIDELFDQFNHTVASLQKSSLRECPSSNLDQSSLESVTTLVRKFSSVLGSSAVKCSPRRQRQCCEKFKDLAEFWKSRTMFEGSR